MVSEHLDERPRGPLRHAKQCRLVKRCRTKRPAVVRLFENQNCRFEFIPLHQAGATGSAQLSQTTPDSRASHDDDKVDEEPFRTLIRAAVTLNESLRRPKSRSAKS